jgi:hypothetical protein
LGIDGYLGLLAVTVAVGITVAVGLVAAVVPGIYLAESGAFVDVLSPSLRLERQLSAADARDVAVASSGDLYVLNTAGGQVTRFGSEGSTMA